MTGPVAGVCRAAVPETRITSAQGRMQGDSPVFEFVFEAPAWRECGQPAVAEYEYTCPDDPAHAKRRVTCAEHEPEEGAVGCRECWEAGNGRPMTFTKVA